MLAINDAAYDILLMLKKFLSTMPERFHASPLEALCN